ncbi:hypothetical protein F4604DRAFT_1576429, partial [Suillus subluteus]
HKEIFAFTRVEKGGKFFKREWEDIVKPVIRKWGLFLMEYYAEGDDAMSFDYWALSFDSCGGSPVDAVNFVAGIYWTYLGCCTLAVSFVALYEFYNVSVQR